VARGQILDCRKIFFLLKIFFQRIKNAELKIPLHFGERRGKVEILTTEFPLSQICGCVLENATSCTHTHLLSLTHAAADVSAFIFSLKATILQMIIVVIKFN